MPVPPLGIDCPQTKCRLRSSDTARLGSRLLAWGDLSDGFNYGRNASLLEEDWTARIDKRERLEDKKMERQILMRS